MILRVTNNDGFGNLIYIKLVTDILIILFKVIVLLILRIKKEALQRDEA